MSRLVQRSCTDGAHSWPRLQTAQPKMSRRKAKRWQRAQQPQQTSTQHGGKGARLLSAEPSQVTGTAEAPAAAPDSSARLRISRRPLLRRAFLASRCAPPAAGSCTCRMPLKCHVGVHQY